MHNWGRIRDCSTRALLATTIHLSVHQLGTLHTLTSFHNAKLTSKLERVSVNIKAQDDTRTRKGQIKEIPVRLNSREESYLPRAIKLYNLLPPESKRVSGGQPEVGSWITSLSL